MTKTNYNPTLGQLREKTLQLDLIKTLNQDIPWQQKMQQAVSLFGSFLDCSLVIFAIQPEGNTEYCHSFEQLGADEFRHFDFRALLEFTGLSEKEYLKAREKSDEIMFATGEDIEEHKQRNLVLKRIADRFGANSWITMPMQLELPGRYRLSFLSKSTRSYDERDKALLLQIRPSLQVTLDKLLAFEKISQLNMQLEQEKAYLQEEVNITYDFAHMIGQSRQMKEVFLRVRQVAKSDTTVLVMGETGTGKELVVRALHDASPRSGKPLVKLNCAALPENLIESELFGHEKGAFTGALKKRIGKFQLAHGGTLFLDEIGELPLPMQAKLLRVIQEKEFEPVGSNQTVHSDFRLIVATNRNLQEAVQQGSFRMDLFYRLNSFSILLPPLRQRTEDIPLLTDHYGHQFAKKLGCQYQGFTDVSLERLLAYHWPGNIRELQNLVEQALITQGNQKLQLEPGVSELSSFPAGPATPGAGFEVKDEELEDITLEDIEQKKNALEKAYLKAVMEKTRWRLSGRKGAAALLDVKYTTLNYRLKKLGLTRD